MKELKAEIALFKEERKCSNCAYADFRYNDAPVGSGRSTFLCAARSSYRSYSDTACDKWKARYKEDK